MDASEFDDFLQTKLNPAQRQAVETIEGPLLVIAGPGTGKTQLLSARVTNILQTTDTPARNILCLTFTDNGATNMRERLGQFIGKLAYEVGIGTYHAFGGDIINRFPQYFQAHNLQQPIDSLGKHQIVASIVEAMPYSNPLKQTQHHLKDLIATISEVKRALLTPDDIRSLANENLQTIHGASKDIAAIFAGVTKMPSKLATALPYFEQIATSLTKHAPAQPHSERYGSLAGVALQELTAAFEQATQSNKTTPLTAWKNSWLEKSADNTFQVSGDLENRRMLALADVVEQYEQILIKQGLYDFDDMILRTIHALETHDELRYTLQEQYLYILLDEFQDTNAAQLRLVELLTNNPLSEGRPNVMAVGDDDQAIYAFQGAQYSNMLDFYHLYRDVTVISLEDNYRSHQAILDTALNITSQMSTRLYTAFQDVTKTLKAKNLTLPKQAHIERTSCTSDIAERVFVADKVAELIATGTKADEIAVLAPKHTLLENLVPFLNARTVPVEYEKRENILETPLISELLQMAGLAQALHQDNEQLANALWPQVLSSNAWNVPVTTIWTMNWKISDSKQQTTWTQELLLSKDSTLRSAGLLFVALAYRMDTEPLETMLDYLTGNAAITTHETDMPEVSSPIKAVYVGDGTNITNAPEFYDLLSQLTVLRKRVRDFQKTQKQTLRLVDLLNLVAAHEAADEPILHTSPYHQAAEAVQLMTVYKAKGLEFEHVFLLSCQDEVWGSSGRNGSNRLTLPANIKPIRYSGTTEDERLRLFYVAITRAKIGLHLTSHTSNYAGKHTKSLKYLDERPQSDGSILSTMLPEGKQRILTLESDKPSLRELELDTASPKHQQMPELQSDLRMLIKSRLDRYQLSPTHLTAFIDLEYGGPSAFFMNTIVRFPSAPTNDNQFGNAIHETLEWVQNNTNVRGKVPTLKAITDYFALRLALKKLPEQTLQLQLERGERALAAYMAARGKTFRKGDRAEARFKHEGVFVGDAHISGAIDKMEINTATRTITVVDYKTGSSHSSWSGGGLKLHKYQLQLYCYKLLVEKSASFIGYTVEKGRLEFVEPDRADNRINHLEISFKPEQVTYTEQLINALWKHVHELNFPDTSEYPVSVTGVRQFENDLIAGNI